MWNFACSLINLTIYKEGGVMVKFTRVRKRDRVKVNKRLTTIKDGNDVPRLVHQYEMTH